MFNFLSSDVTPDAILDFLMPMTATCGEFVRHDSLCKVCVLHTKHRGMLTCLIHPAKDITFQLDEHERALVEAFYKQKEE